jgi:hypothetical protein
MPPSNLKLSVYRSSELHEDAIWELGNHHVAIPRHKPLVGRADLLASDVSDADRELKIEPDTTPHPRHANISGWPTQKDKQKLIAIKLASKALFFSFHRNTYSL